MPMIDVYSAGGTFADKHALARDLAAAVMRWEKVPELPADDPTLAERTWVLLTESPEGGWGINGHANTGPDIAQAAKSQFAELAHKQSVDK
jgi:phenylpyruvate tautomerase PptA (4-oxalocrotonate tautomerase family)